MASNPKRSVAWFGVAVAGAALAAIGTTLSRPSSGIVIILGVAVGIAGIVGARWNTDWYDFDKDRREGRR
jgi:Zn-dependent alcohol dehydrogenase